LFSLHIYGVRLSLLSVPGEQHPLRFFNEGQVTENGRIHHAPPSGDVSRKNRLHAAPPFRGLPGGRRSNAATLDSSIM
jgi:hypothetical protein